MSEAAAIVCGGPSVLSTWPTIGASRRYAHVLAVNDAAKLIPVQTPGWWVIADSVTVALVPDAPPHLALLAPSGTLRGVDPNLIGQRAVYVFDAFQPLPLPQTFSLHLGLVAAASLGATVIDVYGCDWSGAGQFDGIERNGRDGSRWAAERMLTRSLLRYLSHRFGVVVRRVLPADHPPEPVYPWEVGFRRDDLDALGLHVLSASEIERARVQFPAPTLACVAATN